MENQSLAVSPSLYLTGDYIPHFGFVRYVDEKGVVQLGGANTDHVGRFQEDNLKKTMDINISNPVVIFAISKGQISPPPPLTDIEAQTITKWLKDKTRLDWRCENDVCFTKGTNTALDPIEYNNKIKQMLEELFKSEANYLSTSPFRCELRDHTPTRSRSSEMSINMSISGCSLRGLLSIIEKEQSPRNAIQSVVAVDLQSKQAAFKAEVYAMRADGREAVLKQPSNANSNYIFERLNIVDLVIKDDNKGTPYYEVQYHNSVAKSRIYPDGRLTNSKGEDLPDNSPLRKKVDDVLRHFKVDEIERTEDVRPRGQ